jgi:hypothetical protein
MSTLDEFANRMEQRANRLPQAVSEVAASTALVIVSDLAYMTPVDTSKALSSWIVSLDEPSELTPEEGHFVGVSGSTQDESAQATIDAAQRVLAQKQPGQPVFITNNQPYIVRLNSGYSKQQPAGFVERSILIARNALKRIRLNW